MKHRQAPMTHRQALREIQGLGFSIHAQTSFVEGVKFEARRGTTLVKGEVCYNPDEAMASCYRAVLGKVYA